MNEIIKVNYETDEPTVSARSLYEGLEIKKRFSSWFGSNSQGFIEGEDFTSVLSGTVVNNGASLSFVKKLRKNSGDMWAGFPPSPGSLFRVLEMLQ